jgi:hypothetical protein
MPSGHQFHCLLAGDARRTLSDSTDSPSEIIATPLFLLSTFSFSLILSDTLRKPSLPRARRPAGLPVPTGVPTLSFAAARDRVARGAGAVRGGALCLGAGVGAILKGCVMGGWKEEWTASDAFDLFI